MKKCVLIFAILFLTLMPVFGGGGTEKADETATEVVQTGKYSEAPMLSALVAKGELPPVDERLPKEPFVEPILDSIGKYGGTLNVTGAREGNRGEFQNQEHDMYLLRLDEKTNSFVPNLLKDFKFSDDKLTLDMWFREGAKWSNGSDFTADDVIFTLNDLHWDGRVDTGWRGGESPQLANRTTKIDDYHMQLHLTAWDPTLLLKWTTWIGGNYVMYAPKHHLTNWHIDYNEDAEALAKEEGFDTWAQALVFHWDILEMNDLETPWMFPWVLIEDTPQVQVFERNAYFWKVDPKGQQLPYIDRVLAKTTTDREVMNLQIISGEVDWACQVPQFEKYPDYKENEAKGNYSVTLIPGVDCGLAYGFNQTIEDPNIRGLFRDVRFRRAMSLAINRDEINEVRFFGLGMPRAATIHSTVSYWKPEWGTAWADYDPGQANKLFDQVGLTKRDSEGYRLNKDGSKLTIRAESIGAGDETRLYELEIGYWKEVGIRVIAKLYERAYWQELSSAGKTQMGVGTIDAITETWNWINDPTGRGLHGDFQWDGTWGEWWDAYLAVEEGRRKLSDYPGGALPGEEPPEEIKELFGWQTEWGRVEYGSPRYTELAEKIFDFHAEGVYAAGTVGEVPVMVITSNKLGNVPDRYPASNTDWRGNLIYWAAQLYFKE